MILLALAILGVCTGTVSADGPPPEHPFCYMCEFDVRGVGYLPYKGVCNGFWQCIKKPTGGFKETMLCCPNGTRWSQDVKNCVHDQHCMDDCEIPTRYTTEVPCDRVGDDGAHFFWVLPMWIKQKCAPGTVWNQYYCTCIAGGDKGCYDDPLLHWPYTWDFYDIQCPHAKGTPFGDAFIDKDRGCMYLDGDGDFMTFAYLNNWMVDNNPDHFTVSIWFYQRRSGFIREIEGLFANGNCHNPQSVWLKLSNRTVNGGIKESEDNTAIIHPNDDDADGRGYPFATWCQLSIRYNGPEHTVTLFLNGWPVAKRFFKGRIRETMTDSSVGLAYLHCIPYFFTGCLDDLIIFVRYVSNQEMSHCVFGNGRTGPHISNDAAMYRCDW